MLLNVAEAGPPNFAHFARRVSLRSSFVRFPGGEHESTGKTKRYCFIRRAVASQVV